MRPAAAFQAWTALLAVYSAALFLGTFLPEIRNLERVEETAAGLDKVLHAVAFLILGALLVRVIPDLAGTRRPLPSFSLALGFGGAYAILHEGLQALVPSLTFNPMDLLANLAGVILGTGAGFMLFRGTRARGREELSREGGSQPR